MVGTFELGECCRQEVHTVQPKIGSAFSQMRTPFDSRSVKPIPGAPARPRESGLNDPHIQEIYDLNDFGMRNQESFPDCPHRYQISK